MRILVDTNVFIDLLLDRNEETGNKIEMFFDWCCYKKNRIYITSMSLRDIEYTAHRYLHDKKKAKELQFAAFQMSSKVIGISADSAIESLYSDVDDYEDSLIIQAAREEMLDAIVTNNKKDFEKGDIPVFTPEEIVQFANQ